MVNLNQDPIKSKFGTLFCLWLISLTYANEGINLLAVNVGINLRLDRVIFLILVFYYFIYRKKYKDPPKQTREEFVLLLLAAWCLLSILFISGVADAYNYKRNLSSLFNFVVAPVFTFAFIRFWNPKKEDLKKIVLSLLIVGVYLSITGIAEHFRLNAFVFPKYIMDPHVGIHFGRSRGPFVQAVTMGTVLIFSLAALLYYSLQYKSGKLLLIGLPMLTTIYFTYTRSNWVMLAALLFVLSLTHERLRKISVAMVLAIIIIYSSGVFSKFSMHSTTLFANRQNPIYDRLNIMYATLRMINEKALIGHGYGNFGYYVDDYFVFREDIPLRGMGEGNHNVFLGLAAETGIIGGVLYFLFIAFGAKTSFEVLKLKGADTEFKKIWGGLTLGLLFGFFMSSQFYDPRWFQIVNVYTALFIAVCSLWKELPEAPIGYTKKIKA